ncbi:MAG: TolC family protein [Desulfomonilaceae bacterium]|nr:TolC family protein [Desulfomonilaceae bacterium]
MVGSRSSAILLRVAALSAVVVMLVPATSFGAGGRNQTQRAAGNTLNLAQAVQIALARNLTMADARLQVDEKEYQRREAFSDFFPTIDLTYSATGYKYRQPGNVSALASAHDSRRLAAFTPPASFSNYPYRTDPYRGFTMSATMTQPLYTGGRLLNNYKYAQLGVDYSALQVEVTRQDLILEVYQAYYQLIQSQRLLFVAERSIRALEALRNQTREFYRAGVVPKVDVLATEGQLAQARVQRTQALTDIGLYKATLNFLLRYPQETPIDVVEDIEYRPNPYEIPGIYATAAANRIEIRQANISVDQAMALVRIAKSDLLPTVAVQANGARFNDDWNTFDHEAVNDWRLQGILTWTFDMFRRRDTVSDRRANQARSFVARELLVEQIMEQVKTAYLDMKRSESDIQDNRKGVEFRKENFRINQERYKEQVATYVEVLDAERQLALSEGEYYISLTGYWINRAVLERNMGMLRQ